MADYASEWLKFANDIQKDITKESQKQMTVSDPSPAPAKGTSFA